MLAIAKKDITIDSFNAKSPKGNKLRKDRKIKQGEKLEVKNIFTSNGLATYGEECVIVIDEKGNQLSTYKDRFDYIK